MTELTCEHFQDLMAELALGVLSGRERADALAHVERCPACRRDLAAMGDLADRLVELTPQAEPPAGFETRVLARLTPPPATARRRPRPPLIARLAVAAGLAAAIGVGGWAVGRHDGHVPSVAVGHSTGILTAEFVDRGATVGQVVAYGGEHPWVAMAVDSNLGDLTVKCRVLERNGTTTTVGTFTLSDGYGYWGASIGVAPKSVSSVQLVDAKGAPVATATFAAGPI